MKRVFLVLVVLIMTSIAFGDCLQCKDPSGKPVDWFTAIKLPKLKSNVYHGTDYIYMDVENPQWTYLAGIITENSSIGHTVTQMYASTESYNNSIMWIVYNDEPTNNHTTFTLGHTKGILIANNNSGLWLVHSVPKFPQLPYQKNSYSYPTTGVLFGQSFLCISMTASELDKVGNQLINNEVFVYGSHFGDNMKDIYPSLYNSTLPHGKPSIKNNGVRLQHLQSTKGFKFFSISKNRKFGKDLYEDLITNIIQSNIYTETWLNAVNSFNSSCSNQYKTVNIKSLSMKGIKGIENCKYKSSKDHSKWMISNTSSIPWTCIGDINRAREQTHRGGGTVCIDSFKIWNQYKKLVLDVESCKSST